MNDVRTQYPEVSGKEVSLFSTKDYTGRLYGLNICGDRAVAGYSLSQISVSGAPSSATISHISPAGDYYLYSSGVVYRSTGLAGSFFAAGSGYTEEPCFAPCTEGDEDFLIIIGGEKSSVVGAGSISSEGFPAIRHAVVHYFRLFGVDADDPLKIRWSRAGDVRDWEEELYGAGYIRLSADFGKVLSLVPFDDKLIAVRQYGLTVLRVYGDTEDFRVQCTDTACEGIISGTPCVCGSGLYFYTAGGLRFFDGDDIEAPSLADIAGFGNVTAAAALGCTYFACGELNGSPVIACIDVEEGRTSYITLSAPVRCICSGAGRVAAFNGSLYEIKICSTGSWDSGCTDFGVGAVKYLSKLHICGSIQKITVQWNGRTRTFEGDMQAVKVGALARIFRIVVECTALSEVRAEYIARGKA